MINKAYKKDDLECHNIIDKVLDYYKNIQQCDDEEINEIESRVFHHFINISFDNLSISTGELANSINATTDIICQSFKKINMESESL